MGSLPLITFILITCGNDNTLDILDYIKYIKMCFTCSFLVFLMWLLKKF